MLMVARHAEMRRMAHIHREAVLYPDTRIFNHRAVEDIQVGRMSHLHGDLLTFGHGGRIRIGDFVYIGERSRIWSASSVTIGDRVLIAHQVEIHDNNSHPLDPEERHRHFVHIIESGHPESCDIPSAPIVIEEDAWIGFRSSVLKGVRIGARSVIAAGSLVLHDIPPDVLAAGRPARPIRQL